jgi:hypothetical protein
MFYLKKVQKSTFKKQVIVDGILQSEDFTENILNFYFNLEEKNYISDFSNKTSFSSPSEAYEFVPKNVEIDDKTGEITFLPDPDFSSLTKEEAIDEINNRLNFFERKFSDKPTVEYFIVEE